MLPEIRHALRWRIVGPLFFSLLHGAFAQSARSIPKLTLAPAGPYHVRGNRILDANDRPYLIRGTRLPLITLDDPQPFSGTSLITVRQRLNMNAVRLRVQSAKYEADESYRVRVREIVRQANQFELLAIVEPDLVATDSVYPFWTRLAGELKTKPNVFFAISGEDVQHAVDCLRSSGAAQPIIVPYGDSVANDPNIIYETSFSYDSPQTDRLLSEHFPVLVNGLDPQLDLAGPECRAFPSDPGQASKLLGELLDSFDEHSISWTISVLEPGKLIDDFRGYDWLKLDDGWICGESPAHAGIAMVVLSHLWSADPHGVFTVNQPGGGFVIARGAHASAYGRILAGREVRADRPPFPVKLGNISVRVIDSRGAARLAPLRWSGAGWSSINLVIPADSATGPAEVAIVRSDGSVTTSNIIVADVAPALWTGSADGRGPVIGHVSQHYSNGKTTEFPAWECSKYVCRTVPIPLTRRASTTVRLEGTGFRFAKPKTIQVDVGGTSVPVESFGLWRDSLDQVSIKLPNDLIGRGDVDLFLIADGKLSNVVRINCGQQ
jgi:uncharacterized protein (TIGR03437 family)